MSTELSADSYLMQLAKILKRQLHESGVKVTDLSKATKVPLQTIHNWLSGQKPRDISQLKRVADHFGVSLNYLCFGEIDETNADLKGLGDEVLAGVFEVVIRRPKK